MLTMLHFQVADPRSAPAYRRHLRTRRGDDGASVWQLGHSVLSRSRHRPEVHRKIVACMRGRTVALATKCYGYYVLQKALDCEEICLLIVSELHRGDRRRRW
ncbi:hypothetical protein B0H13DRAFT_106585 [Mycena leptocephala]|nr:hypothetical protein B0H13DRAFT_106585 [Mycena leptocephala]